jgi:DNA-binding CsgD family transcriptional regulator
MMKQADHIPALPDFSGLTTEDEIWAAMFGAMSRELGVTAMMFAFTHATHFAARAGLTENLIIRHNVPEDYLETNKGLHLDEDVVVKMSLDGSKRILWSQIDAWDLSTADRERHEQDKRSGFGVGVSYGIRFGGKSGAACLCMGARHADPNIFDAKISARDAELMALAQVFDRNMRPAMVANRMKLTARERDVLSFSAGGMTAKQIANNLGLSPKTIEHTLERARKSLGAMSTAEAVAKSIVYDLVG